MDKVEEHKEMMVIKQYNHIINNINNLFQCKLNQLDEEIEKINAEYKILLKEKKKQEYLNQNLEQKNQENELEMKNLQKNFELLT